MYQMSKNQNNNQQISIVEPETMREKYDRLTSGKKRMLINSYTHFFDSCRTTFFKKINGKTRIRTSEQLFFNNHL